MTQDHQLWGQWVNPLPGSHVKDPEPQLVPDTFQAAAAVGM